MENCGPHNDNDNPEEALLSDNDPEDIEVPQQEESPEEREQCRRRRHGSMDSLIAALKARGVSEEIREIARSFRCPTCQQWKRAAPCHRSTPGCFQAERVRQDHGGNSKKCMSSCGCPFMERLQRLEERG